MHKFKSIDLSSIKGNKISAAIGLLVALCVLVSLAVTFLGARVAEPIYAGPGVTRTAMLSDYFDGIAGTAGDTEIYIFEGEKPGASLLVLGGTHPNEPSGLLTAVLFIENAVVTEGTLYVIPRTNSSAFTCTDPQEAEPMQYTIDTPGGARSFRFGSRATNPVNQWPDPDIYLHSSSGQLLSGSETRNINRTYPGRPDGSFTEKVSYAVTELIRQENITITVDLHEAAPEYPTINALVAHERAMSLASSAVFGMQLQGMPISLEPSPTNLHGLTHRELGDYTDTLAVLMETANPAQGRLRGRTDEALVLTGQDPLYVKAGQYGRLYVPFGDSGHPISERVARHTAGVLELLAAAGEAGQGNIEVSGVPGYAEIISQGIGAYLLPPE
ncbi:MAG: succinylglutamate desuccinylase [Christensenellaceae bacterium]|jgi:predicted deacylase|nr:succinylglutamate desuccinylase [Christensenellaceae bacterium]